MTKPKTIEKYQDMSLRDYFAGVALMRAPLHYHPETAAKKAYEYADAMLAAKRMRRSHLPRGGE